MAETNSLGVIYSHRKGALVGRWLGRKREGKRCTFLSEEREA